METSPELPRTTARHKLILVGALVFTLGALLSFAASGTAGYVAGTALRWSGLAALAAAGWSRKSLTYWILFSTLLGAEIGLDFPSAAERLHVLSDIFLRLVKVIVAPLIFGSLVTGIAGHRGARSLGSLAVKSFAYFALITVLALAAGWAAISISRAGDGLLTASVGSPEAGFAGVSPAPNAPSVIAAAPRWNDFLLRAFPDNIARAIADDQILEIAVFSILFGFALSRLPESKRAPMISFCESLAAIMFAFTNLVMYFCPFAVAGAMAYTVGHIGIRVLLPLGHLAITAYAAFGAFLLLALLPLMIVARLPLLGFVRAVAEPASIGFATSTSEAALPRAMEEMEAYGASRRVVSFVIPAGYSFNLGGSTVFLAMTAIFLAQAGGIHLSFGEQLLLMLTLTVTSKGIVGVPRAAYVVLLATAASFHLPIAPVAVLLGVDVVMDMGRTSVNVIGNCAAAAILARWEGEFGPQLQGTAT